MSREWRLYLADLLLGCEKIQRSRLALIESLASDPSVPLAEPPFQREEGGEDEQEGPVVPDLVLGRAEVFGVGRLVDALEVLAQALVGDRLAAGDLGDLPGQGEVGGGVLQLAVVLVDEEPGRVAADLLAVLAGDDGDLVVAGLAGRRRTSPSLPLPGCRGRPARRSGSGPRARPWSRRSTPVKGAPLASRAVTVISSFWPTLIRRRSRVSLTWLSPSFSLCESQKITCLQNLRWASRPSSEARAQTQVSPP